MHASASAAPHDARIGVLLACGALAGPLFTLVWLVAGAVRVHYDSFQHPISSLAIGSTGWVQNASFLVSGSLTLAFAIGLRRILPSLGGSRWGPRLITLIGLGLVGAGLFVTDPLNGYPPGTPLIPSTMSTASRWHGLFSAFVFLGWPPACWLFARFFARWGAVGWARYSALTGVAFSLLFILTIAGFEQVAGLGRYAGLLQRLTVSVGWLWLTLLALFLRNAARQPPSTPQRSQ